MWYEAEDQWWAHVTAKAAYVAAGFTSEYRGYQGSFLPPSHELGSMVGTHLPAMAAYASDFAEDGKILILAGELVFPGQATVSGQTYARAPMDSVMQMLQQTHDSERCPDQLAALLSASARITDVESFEIGGVDPHMPRDQEHSIYVSWGFEVRLRVDLT